MPKVINIHENQESARWIFKVTDVLIPSLLSKSDIVSFDFASKIYDNSAVLIETSIFEDRATAIRMIQLVINLANIVFQYSGNWTTYLFGSVSGLKKIYYCIFKNPVYGVLFFSTFYTKLLDKNVDQDVFDGVVTKLGLPSISAMGAADFVKETSLRVGDYVSDALVTFGVEGIEKAVEKEIAGVSIALMTNLPNITLDSMLAKMVDSSEGIIPKDITAVDLGQLNLSFDTTEITKHISYVNSQKAKADAKKNLKNTKRGFEKAKAIREQTEMFDETGKKICLGDCKNQVKTKGGCYCDGECGTYTAFGGENWCWVDPVKCKKAKTRATFMGKHFDYCDPTKKTDEKMCFTGYYYDVCGGNKSNQLPSSSKIEK